MSKNPEWSEQEQQEYRDRLNEAAGAIIAAYLSTNEQQQRRAAEVEILKSRSFTNEGIVDVLSLVARTLAARLTSRGPQTAEDIESVVGQMRFEDVVAPVEPLTDVQKRERDERRRLRDERRNRYGR